MSTAPTIHQDAKGKIHLEWAGLTTDTVEVSIAVLQALVQQLNKARGFAPKVVGAFNISPYGADVDVFHHPSLESAEAGRDADAYMTLVRYDDGTAEVAWMSHDLPVVVS